MPRPPKCRWISAHPGVCYFKPAGVPQNLLRQVELTMDELEALRLSDLIGLSQTEAAMHMNISRATFGRIVAKARNKIAEALVNGMAINITGGSVELRPPVRRRRGSRGFNFNHG
ncbi:DUF134 domain-containing protein [bacterium]|nr:DUF134 domain-containing protein [bacterium]